MAYLENIHAVWFDAFWTLIDDSKRKGLKEVFWIFKKYWLKLSDWEVVIKDYPTNTEHYYEEIFNKLFKSKWDWESYLYDVSESDKNILQELIRNELKSYTLRKWTNDLLYTIKQNVDSIFLISNIASPYIKKVEELLPEWIFDFSLYSCREGVKKTLENTLIFDRAFENLWEHMMREQILFTWDSTSNDIIAPQKAWMNTIHIDSLRANILNHK